MHLPFSAFTVNSGLCWSKEANAVSEWWEHHLAVASFISVLNSQSKNHKGVLLFWGKCVNFTKLFRWWEIQVDQLWLPSWEVCRSPFHVAYGKKPTRIAVVTNTLPLIRTHPTTVSHEQTQQYNAMWALLRLGTFITMDFFFQWKNVIITTWLWFCVCDTSPLYGSWGHGLVVITVVLV